MPAHSARASTGLCPHPKAARRHSPPRCRATFGTQRRLCFDPNGAPLPSDDGGLPAATGAHGPLRARPPTGCTGTGGDQHAPYHSMQRGRHGSKSRSPRRRHQGADFYLPRRVTAGASATPLPPRPWPAAPCARAHARAIRPSPHAPRSARRPSGHPPHAPAGLAEAAAGGPPRHAGEADGADVAGAGAGHPYGKNFLDIQPP